MLTKKYCLVITTALCFCSCATSHVVSVTNEKTNEPLKKILVLSTEANYELSSLDSATYNTYVRGSFNNLSNAIFRKQLEKAVARGISSNKTEIIKSSDIYSINRDISYTDFKKAADSLAVDGILLINLNNYWNTTSTRVTNTYNTSIETKTDEEPNASYNCYLMNPAGNKVLWMAQVVVNGQFAGYDVLNTKLSAKLRNTLSKEQLIAAVD